MVHKILHSVMFISWTNEINRTCQCWCYSSSLKIDPGFFSAIIVYKSETKCRWVPLNIFWENIFVTWLYIPIFNEIYFGPFWWKLMSGLCIHYHKLALFCLLGTHHWSLFFTYSWRKNEYLNNFLQISGVTLVNLRLQCGSMIS
jgi:hypothetical protein